jgi:hypothetical protein
VFAVLMVFAFNPLYQGISRLVDSAFYSRRYDYQATISDTSEKLVSVLDYQLLLQIISEAIAGSLTGRLIFILYDYKNIVFTAVAPDPAGYGTVAVFEPDNPSIEYIRGARRPVFREEYTALAGSPESALQSSIFETLGVELCVPMTYKNELRGFGSGGSDLCSKPELRRDGQHLVQLGGAPGN